MKARLLPVTRRVRRAIATVTRGRRLALPLGLAALLPKRAQADMSVIEAFLAGNDFECVRLTFEGFCVWLVINVSLFSIDVGFHLTPKISHYNPELLVATTGRINTSPLTDADLLYGTISREFSKPALELLNGQDVPATYDSVDGDFASKGSSTGASAGGGVHAKRSYIFSEVDIVGSPGNVLTMYAEGFGSLSQTPQVMLQGINSTLSAAEQFDQVIESTSGAIAPTPTDEPLRINDLAESEQFDGWWDNVDFSPTTLATALLGEDVAGLIDGAAGVYTALEDYDFDVSDAVQDSIENAQETINGAVSDVSDVLGDVNDFLDDNDDVDDGADVGDVDVGDTGDAVDVLTEELLAISIEELAEELEASVEELQEQLAETLGALEDLQNLVESAQISGGSGLVIHPWRNFCLRDATTYKPYFLSGLDIIAWRFRIPEMVYPQTFSLPFMRDPDETQPHVFTATQNHVGTFGGGELTFGDLTLPDFNYWGPIYPRAGGMMSTDMIKARAVAASRAVHVVTRPNEPHIYWHLGERTRSGWRTKDFDGSVNPPPSAFSTQNEETGSWQLIDTGANGGSGGHSCLRFGDEDNLLPDLELGEDGEFPETVGGYTELARSEDGRLLYNFWRKKVCCEEPNGTYTRYLDDLDIQIEVPL